MSEREPSQERMNEHKETMDFSAKLLFRRYRMYSQQKPTEKSQWKGEKLLQIYR